jgi:rhomboid family GlyGly-CTERM serine protease
VKALRVPLLLFALPAVLIAVVPALRDAFVYRRDALAQGELWRLWTGHWVHFSPSHLAWNLLVVVAVGAHLERLRPGLLLRHTLLVAPLLSLTLLVGEPAMQIYGGLSGLATSLAVLLALHLCSTRSDRFLGSGLLVLVSAKLLHDTLTPLSLFARFASADVQPSALAHGFGAALAVLYYTSSRVGPRVGLQNKTGRRGREGAFGQGRRGGGGPAAHAAEDNAGPTLLTSHR